MMMLASAANAQVSPNLTLGNSAGVGNFGINPLTGLPIGNTPLLEYGADVGLGETDNVFLSPTTKSTRLSR